MTSLIAALLLTQAVQVENWINWTSYRTFGASQVRVPLRLPLSATGPLLTEDAGTVSHVYWNGSALVDTLPNAWTMNGTVPQVAASVSPFVPGKAGAGPYSAANSYQGPTTLGEWQGDWSVTVVWKPTTTVSQYLIGKQNAAQTQGWGCYSGAAIQCQVHDGLIRTTGSAGSATPVAINVATFGKSGGTCYARLNGGAAGSIACGTMTAATAEPIRIGRIAVAGAYAVDSTIYEILASTTPYSDALHAARFNAVFGMLPGPVSVTRADPLTYTANGFVWSAPPAAMAISASGAEVWKGSTNYVLNSGTHAKAAEATGSLPTGAFVAWHTGVGTMTVANGTATTTGLSCAGVSPGTVCTFTVTVAGTMAITTSAGTVTAAQVEPGLYPTPYIATAGTATARAATVASVPLPSLGNKWCVSATVSAQDWTSGSQRRFLSNFQGAAVNVLDWQVNGANIQAINYDSAGGVRTVTWAHGYVAGSSHRLTYCNNQGTPAMYSDGVLRGSLTGAGTALWTATPTPLYIGSILTTNQFDGSISNVKACRGATKYAECP